MEIKQINTKHTQEFCNLIIDMYSHLQNLEWFTPMPFDFESVKSIIENDRFFIIGIFENNTLCAVSSLDYKCGKLIGKIDLPKDCNLNNTVEIAFNIVHSKYQGNGLMKIMVKYLLEKIYKDGYKYALSKAHKNNIASYKSLLKNDFKLYSTYKKEVDINDFKSLSNQTFFSKTGKENAKRTLTNYSNKDKNIVTDYNIYIKIF